MTVEELIERGQRLRNANNPALSTSFFAEAGAQLLMELMKPKTYITTASGEDSKPYRQQGAHHHPEGDDGRFEDRPCHRIHYQGEPSGLREPKLSEPMLELMGRNGMTWEDVIA